MVQVHHQITEAQLQEVWRGIHFVAYQEEAEPEPGIFRTFEHVWRIDGARTIAENSSGKILLSHEWRFELNGYDWRLPGGRLRNIDEEPQVAAARELDEETGVTAKKWKYLWTTSPESSIKFQRHFFYATELTLGKPKLDEGEKIEISWFDLEDARNMAIGGDIKEEISALAIIRHAHEKLGK